MLSLLSSNAIHLAAPVLDQQAISVLDAQTLKKYWSTANAFATLLATTSTLSEQLSLTAALLDARYAPTQLDSSLQAVIIVIIPLECVLTHRQITALHPFSMVSHMNSQTVMGLAGKTVPQDTMRSNR